MPAPELMAVGDSIYNGVRSLTITRDLASCSVPAQVARAFGWTFVSPDYPRPILADFEDKLFRHPISGALALVATARANATAWLSDTAPSPHDMFHNLSIAQQTVAHVAGANSAAARRSAQALLATLDFSTLPALYQALNTGFVLDPRGLAAEHGRTAIDLIAAAQPRRLLVNIGINDGLWALALQADATDYRSRIDPTVAMAGLAGELAQRCPKTERFYVNLLPKPSALANLAPRRDDEIPQDGYFDFYLSRLIQAGGISGDTMREIDRFVADDLNPRIRAAFSSLGARVHFVDLYGLTAAYDSKNRIATKQLGVQGANGAMALVNWPLEAWPVIGGLAKGGLFGLDNLHPTVPGYGLLAQAVCDKIAEVEGGTAPSIAFQPLYDGDSLLHDLPGSLDRTAFMLSFVGAFVGWAAAPPPPPTV